MVSEFFMTIRISERGLERFLTDHDHYFDLVEIQIGNKRYMGILGRKTTKRSTWTKWEWEVTYFNSPFFRNPSYFNMRLHKLKDGEIIDLPVMSQSSSPYYTSYKISLQH